MKEGNDLVTAEELARAAGIKHKKMAPLKRVRRGIFITIGAILMATALEIFLIPNKIMDGGIVGLSIILSQLSKFQLGFFLIALNLPFLFFGYKLIGKTFAISTFFGIGVLSFATAYLHHVEPFTNDMLLVTFFGGVILGVGVGIVIRYGGALDGAEILAILLTKKLPFSVGEIVMFINLFVFGWGGFVFGWEQAMYSVLSFMIAFKTMDIVIRGLNEMKSVFVISDRSKEIGDAIVARLGRGVTYLSGEGAYTGDEKKVIFCVITRIEEAKLKDIITDIDDEAFLAIADINEAHGGRFKKRDIH